MWTSPLCAKVGKAKEWKKNQSESCLKVWHVDCLVTNLTRCTRERVWAPLQKHKRLNAYRLSNVIVNEESLVEENMWKVVIICKLLFLQFIENYLLPQLIDNFYEIFWMIITSLFVLGHFYKDTLYKLLPSGDFHFRVVFLTS